MGRSPCHPKALAVNLENGFRYAIACFDVAVEKSIIIPEKQVGSSIMPGKINPVIPEFVISSSHKVYSNDNLVSSLCGQGCLELNAYLPVIGNAVIESIKLLTASCKTAGINLFTGLKVNDSSGYYSLLKSPAITTALTPHIGYHKAATLAKLMKEKKIDIFDANNSINVIEKTKLNDILKPGNLLKLGFSLSDL